MLVAFAPALVRALHVAVVYGDIQVVALFLWDRRVRERLGESGQAGAALRVGEALQQRGVPSSEGAWLLPRLCQICLACVLGGGVGKADVPRGLARSGYGPLEYSLGSGTGGAPWGPSATCRKAAAFAA